jgi:hypothetical protein
MAAHRNRLRVRVRSCVDGHILRYVSESEARLMIAQNADGSDKYGEDGKPMEAVAYRLSRLKAALTDIKMAMPLHRDRQSPCTITWGETVNSAFVHPGVRLSAKDAIRPLDAAVNKVQAWPSTHDDKAPVISAGKPYGVFCPYPPIDQTRIVTFA